MIFFLDENFPKSAGKYLLSLGHEIIDIRATSKEGLSDNKIFELAQNHKAIFLTTDRDFFHTIPHLFENHYGVIVIALRQPNRQSIINKLVWTIENLDLFNFSNKIVLLRDRHYTILGK
jgi:predicted nuclease of predicted toxin-antitoxin system